MEHKDKDQVARLELAVSFILCGYQAYKTHSSGIAMFVHEDDRIKVVCGKFTENGSNVAMMRI
jgi:hypothetical protein